MRQKRDVRPPRRCPLPRFGAVAARHNNADAAVGKRAAQYRHARTVSDVHADTGVAAGTGYAVVADEPSRAVGLNKGAGLDVCQAVAR